MLGCCWSREAGPLAASLAPRWVCLCGRDVKRSWFIMNLRDDYLTCSCLESNTGCVKWNGDCVCAFVYVLKRAAGMLVFLVLCCISALWRMYEYIYMCVWVCVCVFQSLPADFCMALQISASQHHPPSMQQQREWEIDAKKKTWKFEAANSQGYYCQQKLLQKRKGAVKQIFSLCQIKTNTFASKQHFHVFAMQCFWSFLFLLSKIETRTKTINVCKNTNENFNLIFFSFSVVFFL